MACKVITCSSPPLPAGVLRVRVCEARPAAVRLSRRLHEGEMPHVLPAAR